MIRKWKTIATKKILDRQPYLTVEEHQIQLPNGRIIEDWTWVITPDFVLVAVLTEENKWLCIEQFKYAIKGVTLATVGGYIEPGETHYAAAKRELLEETGYEASVWQFLGEYVVDANRGKATGYLYLAKGARKVAEINSDDLEDQEIIFLSHKAFNQAIIEGKFREMSYQTAAALALLNQKTIL